MRKKLSEYAGEREIQNQHLTAVPNGLSKVAHTEEINLNMYITQPINGFAGDVEMDVTHQILKYESA